MENLISKIETIYWFINRPRFYPYFFELIRRRLLRKNDNFKRSFAEERCRLLSVDLSLAIDQIFTTPSKKDFFIDFKSEIEKAQLKINNAPVSLGGAGGLNLLYNVVLNGKPNNILETGVAFGWSSFSILAGISKNDIGRLISVDMPYPKLENEEYVGFAIPNKLKSKWFLIREPDRFGLLKALKKLNWRIDLCHYDSDKSYSGRLWAYPILWKYLSENGIFISDDVQDNSAFIEFSQSVNKQPIFTECENKYIGILIK